MQIWARKAAWGIVIGWALCTAGRVVVADDKANAEYAKQLASVRDAIGNQKYEDARKQLDATDKTQRGFEFEYHQKQLDAAREGERAPDRITFLKKPDVDTRYGVLHPSERIVAFICRDGSVRVYDLTNLEAPPKNAAHPKGEAIWSGVFSRDGKRFFSGHQNGDVIVWDVGNWTALHTISLGEVWPVRELAAAPDGRSFVAEAKKELELWSLAEEQPKKVAGVGERFNFGEGLAFSPTGDAIATGGMFDIKVIDAKTGELRSTTRHASYTMGIEFSPDGKRFASAPRGNVNKFLAVFEIGKTDPLFNVGPLANYVAGMGFSPDGKRIATVGCDKAFRIYHADSGELMLTLPRTDCGAKPAFTHDGRLLGWSEPAGFYFIDLGAPK